MPCFRSMLLSNQGPFPRPALPGVSSTTSPSATPPARPDPRGVPVWSMPDHRRGFPCCLFSHLPCVPAPVPRREQTGAPEARFPVRHRPSLNSGGSAPATNVSRPAQCLLALRPAWSLNCSCSPSHQSASVHVVASINRPGCYQPEPQLLRGVRTRQREAPYHGARNILLYQYWR